MPKNVINLVIAMWAFWAFALFATTAHPHQHVLDLLYLPWIMMGVGAILALRNY